MRAPLWWVLARGWRLVWAVPTVLALAAVQAGLPDVFTTPALRAALPITAPTACVAGSLAALTAVVTIDEPSPQVRNLSSRPRRLLGQLRVVLLLLITNAVVAAAAHEQATATLTVTLIVAGEGLIVWATLGRFTWVVPAVHVTASLLLGATTFGGTVWWAWPANPHPTGYTLTASAALFISGLALSLQRTGNSPTQAPARNATR